MDKVYYDMIYLISCGVNEIKPVHECIDIYRNDQHMQSVLYQVSKIHFLDALIGQILQENNAELSRKWKDSIAKAIRRVILFDTERMNICSFMEQNKIWYLPLKGIILKDYYPSAEMRQMSDNDILYDDANTEKLRQYMVAHGYQFVYDNSCDVDIYKKAPVYNFEMHRALFGRTAKDVWQKYYSGIKEHLVLDEQKSFGYHMSDEDFYIYMVCHTYKHFIKKGIGLRALLDFFLYLRVKAGTMDWDYIQRECGTLGIADFEMESRVLCDKVFSSERANSYGIDAFKSLLSHKELTMLLYYISSGAYGNIENKIENDLKAYKQESGRSNFTAKMKYLLKRFFPGKEIYGRYTFYNKHRWAVPFFWFHRFINIVLSGERRERAFREIKAVRFFDR